MDFLAQQFIANANRLRNRLRELSAKVDALEGTLSNLTDRLKDVKDAIDRHQEAETKSREIHPPTAVTELRTQVPISVQTYAQRSTKERVWGKIKGTLEVAVGIAVILYTGISYKTWQQTIDATNFTARQIKLSRQGLNETVKNFKIEERPYVAITQAIQQPLTIGTNAIDFTIENSGKTPALGMIVSPEIFVGAKRLKVTSSSSKRVKACCRPTKAPPPPTTLLLPSRMSIASVPENNGWNFGSSSHIATFSKTRTRLACVVILRFLKTPTITALPAAK